MDWLQELMRRISYLRNRRQMEEELAEEMRLHQELRAEALGAESDAARRRFGNELLLREDSRAVWGWAWVDTVGQDVRYALRALKAHPAFALTAVLSLALGIGANTAIFTILNAVMLRTLPVEEPQRLVQVQMGRQGSFTNPLWEELRARAGGFDGLLAYGVERFDLAAGGESRYARGLMVSGSYFEVLGVRPELGRMLGADDDHRGGAAAVAVVSHAFWQRYFGGAGDVVGRTVSLDRRTFEVVGVAPEWFTGLDVDNGWDVAIPIASEPGFHPDRSWLDQRSTWWLRVVGRVAKGTTREQAEARLNGVGPEILRAAMPGDWGAEDQKEFLARTFNLKEAATGFSATRDQYRKGLYTLMGVVGMVLLIACANIANLMLARGAARQREISVRLAIGAGRGRLVRQLLTESLVLAGAGAAGGLLFARWGSGLLVRLFSTSRDPLNFDLAPDAAVLLFTTGAAVVTGLLFGLVPALRATSVAPNSVLKENARGTVGTRFRLGKALVAVQVALSLVLLVAAGLFLGSLRNLIRKGTGFEEDRVLMAHVDTLEKVPAAQRRALYEGLAERFRGLSGVEAAAGAAITPMRGMQWNNEVHPQGYQPKSRRDLVVWFNEVTPDYFLTMRTPLVMGRDFGPGDTAGSAKVMIVNESTARHFFGRTSPVGKTMEIDAGPPPARREAYVVVGVVRDAVYSRVREEDSRTVYLALSQNKEPWPSFSFLLRTKGDPSALAPGVRGVLKAAHPGLALEMRALKEVVGEGLVQERTVALLSGFFGGLALVLAMIGLYGVNAYSVERRQAEIGIRMALGASRGSVVRLVMRDVGLVLAAGIGLGLSGALAAGRLVESLLYGVKPADGRTLAGCSLLLVAAALFAAWLPARRAARLDPVTALREE